MSRRPSVPPFRFLAVDRLSDGVIELKVEATDPADPGRGHVPCYRFGIVPRASGTRVGSVRLRVGSVESTPSLLTSGHVGYEVDEPFRGHGYAGRACRLIAPVARAHGLSELVITCAPENAASRRTCERLGARLVGTFEVPRDHPMYAEGRRQVLRYLYSVASER